ncbi:hypothetical protein, partial [Glutamicibacter sp. AOP33-2CA-4]|uniref:hypothetical protein n=1 Tax=Glutamicibacter sp. AOP33-2CA-4 TaxID=3457690 RepID=UPI00403440A4
SGRDDQWVAAVGAAEDSWQSRWRGWPTSYRFNGLNLAAEMVYFFSRNGLIKVDHTHESL